MTAKEHHKGLWFGSEKGSFPQAERPSEAKCCKTRGLVCTRLNISFLIRHSIMARRAC